MQEGSNWRLTGRKNHGKVETRRRTARKRPSIWKRADPIRVPLFSFMRKLEAWPIWGPQPFGPRPQPPPTPAALGAAGTGQDIHLLQFDVLPGIGGARPSTRPAGPPHTVGAVCGAAYPRKRGRRFGHPGGGAVLMLPQGPAGLRSARLAPPQKKGKAKPCGRVAALPFFWCVCRAIFPAKVPGAEKRPYRMVAVFRPRGPPPPPGINRGGGVVAPRPCVGTTPSRAGGFAVCGPLRAAAATISNGPHRTEKAPLMGALFLFEPIWRAVILFTPLTALFSALLPGCDSVSHGIEHSRFPMPPIMVQRTTNRL